MSSTKIQVPPSVSYLYTPSLPLIIGLQNCLSSISSDRPIKEIKSQILAFIQRIGPEGEKVAISYLLQSYQQQQGKDKLLTSFKISLLTDLIKEYCSQGAFLSYFPEIVVKICQINKIQQFISSLNSNLKLPSHIQITIALSFYLSDRSELTQYGENELVTKLKQFSNTDKLVKLSKDVLEQLLFQVNINPQLNARLENQTKFLLDMIERYHKNNEFRLYNYMRQEWQLYGNELFLVDKPFPINLKKSDILKDLGPLTTAQTQTLKLITPQIGLFNEEDIFDCLMMMTQEKPRLDNGLDRFILDLLQSTSSGNNKKNLRGDQLKKLFAIEIINKKNGISWNTDAFLQFITQTVANIKWQNVIASLDRQNLVFASDQHFVQMMKALEKVKKLIKKWSLNDTLILKKWNHQSSQAQFLVRLFSCKDGDCLFFTENQGKKGQIPKQTMATPTQEIWSYPELVTLLVELSSERRQRIKGLIVEHTLMLPELTLRTLSQIKASEGKQLISQIFDQIMPILFEKEAAGKILPSIWRNNRELVLKTIRKIYERNLNSEFGRSISKKKGKSRQKIEKMVETIKQVDGCLHDLTSSCEYSTCFPLALTAIKKQYLMLDLWVDHQLEKDQQKFSKYVIKYLQEQAFKKLRLVTESDQKQAILEESYLNVDILNKMLIVLIEKLRHTYPSSKNIEQLKKMHKQFCKLIPEAAEGQIFQEAERECEEWIKAIYKGDIKIEDAIQNLKQMKNSTKKEEKQNFVNRITFLCIQLLYHHSYPEKQLMITADMFSFLINENLVEKKIYQTILHILNEDLREESPLFTFAVRLIQKIRSRIVNQTWFCQKLIDNELMIKKFPEFIEQLVKQMQPPISLSLQKQQKIKQAIRLKNAGAQANHRQIIIEPQTHHQHTEAPKVTPIEFDILTTLDKTKQLNISDRDSKLKLINLIFNTISLNNVQEKVKQLKKGFDTKKLVKLFTYHFVFKRLTIQNENAFEIYAKLLEHFPQAQKPILDLTYQILENWFNLKGKSALNDKKFTSFKSLGAWIGRMTLGRGVPVPIYKLNIKKILIRAYQQSNRLNYTIPTIVKMFEFCTLHPNVFRIQSPWLCRIARTLHEISEDIHEQTLKSQIKAMLKLIKLDRDMQKILLNETPSITNNKQFSINEIIKQISLSEEIIKISEESGIKDVKVFASKILDLSITDIIEPVIDRTVKIAITTTTSIINKDFATQLDAEKFKQSALSLVKQLAAPLAQVTCREPLKNSIIKNINDYIKQLSVKIKEEKKQYFIQKISTDIIEIGCSIIKQRASRSAQKTIKQVMIESIQLRNRIKKQGKVFYNENEVSKIPIIVPQQLRVSNNGLTEQEYAVYRELKKAKQKNLPFIYKSQSYDERLIQYLEDKEQISKIKALITDDQPISDDFFNKLHHELLDQNTIDSEQYYFQLCSQIRQFCDPHLCWALFKDIAEVRTNSRHQKVAKKLVKRKYFEENVLNEINEVENQSIAILEKWIRSDIANSKELLSKIQQKLKLSNIRIDMFFYHASKFVIKSTLQSREQQTSCLSPIILQKFAYLLVQYYKKIESTSIQTAKIFESVIRAWLDFEKKSLIPTQRILFKILVNSIEIINKYVDENKIDVSSSIIYTCYLVKQLFALSPDKCPGFSFSWLQIICNKHILKSLLGNWQYWDLYFKAIQLIFGFLNNEVTEQRLKNKQDGYAYENFYLGVLRLIVVLTHDFSSFVNAFSLNMLVQIDTRFLQLRNIINSSFPVNQFLIPLKFEKREDLEQFVKKVGYPKYYKLDFNKTRLAYYISSNPSEQNYKQNLSKQNDYFLQNLVLYFGWAQHNNLSQTQSIRKLTEIINHSKTQLKLKLVGFVVNLIRYPNYITLYFMDFISAIFFKGPKDNSLRELILENIIKRMKIEEPTPWGLIYLMTHVLQRKILSNLGLSSYLLEQI